MPNPSPTWTDIPNHVRNSILHYSAGGLSLETFCEFSGWPCPSDNPFDEDGITWWFTGGIRCITIFAHSPKNQACSTLYDGFQGRGVQKGSRRWRNRTDVVQQAIARDYDLYIARSFPDPVSVCLCNSVWKREPMARTFETHRRISNEKETNRAYQQHRKPASIVYVGTHAVQLGLIGVAGGDYDEGEVGENSIRVQPEEWDTSANVYYQFDYVRKYRKHCQQERVPGIFHHPASHSPYEIRKTTGLRFRGWPNKHLFRRNGLYCSPISWRIDLIPIWRVRDSYVHRQRTVKSGDIIAVEGVYVPLGAMVSAMGPLFHKRLAPYDEVGCQMYFIQGTEHHFHIGIEPTKNRYISYVKRCENDYSPVITLLTPSPRDPSQLQCVLYSICDGVSFPAVMTKYFDQFAFNNLRLYI